MATEAKEQLRELYEAIGAESGIDFDACSDRLTRAMQQADRYLTSPSDEIRVRHIEPGDDGRANLVSVSPSEAVRQARAAFAQAKPGVADPRSDIDALEDYMTVHWVGMYAEAATDATR